MFDLIIIGAGPAGIACGIEAQKSGLEYLILEKGYLVNSLYNFPTNMTFFSTSQNLEIGSIPFISHSDKPTRKEALEYYRRICQGYKLNIRYKTKVTGIAKASIGFLVTTPSETFHSAKVIIATGYFDTPRMLDVPGENLGKVKHYYDDAHPYIGTDVAVVGGANSACDVALETWHKGARVTMVVREQELYQKVKYWILPNIENRIKEGSIKAYFNSEIMEIREDDIEIRTPEGLRTLANDYVLAMTGYKPDYTLLEMAGIEIQAGPQRLPVIDQDTLESSVAGIYLAGVVVSGLNTSALFIENTRHHGKTIIRDILLKST